ncbi:MAG TPA: PTS sugar transporter subunit IIA [Candidatus Saccharicenans sp.]|nr:PTS sugar transporter subunit IIA [Candidatus Saccharicenans sp.]HOE14936.1 PTS sugar transporter subunit IIA [Candidatus Saccharicenans sp.]HPB59608.1 PTS sugar transporter subunit IIA [Candidatus Saccharicenans sp.]HQM75489.1 PTS sugar transporter subunit IIA [Candidatus Saccharicenans sp.]HQO76409.1 PTS sugar transporter subunit IIA [Candidatus Saccharicenans sp.]
MNLKEASFGEFLKPAQVIFELKSHEKVEAIEELLNSLVKQKLISNKNLTLTRIIDRENLESTALGHGIAVPHARVDTEGHMAVAVGRSAEGIDFSAPDSRPVHLIILVVWNPTIPGLFNHLFAGLASFLIKPDNRDRLFNARDKNELYNVLAQIPLAFPYEDRIVNRASLLRKLQEIELKIRRAPEARQEELQKHRALIREELDQSLLARFDLLMDRYGYAVSEVVDGVCQSCNMSVSTQMASAIEESNDIYICENCGKYLVSPGKKEKAVTKEKTEKEKVESLKKAASPAVKVRPGKQVSARQTKAEKSRKN